MNKKNLDKFLAGLGLGLECLCDFMWHLVPEGSQVLHISHGRVEASGEGNIDVEADSGPAAHLQREACDSHSCRNNMAGQFAFILGYLISLHIEFICWTASPHQALRFQGRSCRRHSDE